VCDWVTLFLPRSLQRSDWPERQKPVYTSFPVFIKTLYNVPICKTVVCVIESHFCCQVTTESDWPESHKPVYIVTYPFENTRCQHTFCLPWDWVCEWRSIMGPFYLLFCGYLRCCGVAREHCNGVSCDRHVNKQTNSTKELIAFWGADGCRGNQIFSSS